jgi:hypothetical protein
MPDHMSITTPVTGNEGMNKIPSAKQSPDILPIDPTKVTQPNTDKQSDQNTSFNFLLNRNSVFNKFLQQLGETPPVSQTLQKIMFDAFNRADRLSSDSPSALLMKQLSSAMEMDQTEILKNLMFQSNNRTKFSGPIFDVFRNLLKEHPESSLGRYLSSFLKSYDAYFSTPDTTSSIAAQLNALVRQMPSSYGNALQELADQVMTEKPFQNVDANLTLLKQKVLPLLSQYVSATNDFGLPRDGITLLVHHIARLNVSSRQELVEEFSSLLDYCRYELNLSTDKMNNIQSLFLKSITEASQEPSNSFYDSLIAALKENLGQSTSNVSQSMYKDVVSSLLLDNSVYMPFNHLFLPINYNGKFMFSEIWIEKDDEGSPSSPRKQNEKTPKPLKLFLTFDIKSLGYFETALSLSEKNVDVKLSCPPGLEKNKQEIADKLNQIFSQNGLTAKSIELSAPIKVDRQIMKKIFERKNIIDVTV